MADYTDLPDTAVGVGGTPSGTTVTALRDNPIAIAEGAVGAPRIQTAAFQDSAVTTAKLASNERMTTSNVLGETAGASVGAVGTYAFLSHSGDFSSAGQTRAAADLRYSNADGTLGGTSLAGTWRCMGFQNTTTVRTRTTLWLRIS